MKKVTKGQCGLCAHFGEAHEESVELHRIRMTKEAPESFTDECGHPQHRPLHLIVTPISGCAGFEPAVIEAQR